MLQSKTALVGGNQKTATLSAVCKNKTITRPQPCPLWPKSGFPMIEMRRSTCNVSVCWLLAISENLVVSAQIQFFYSIPSPCTAWSQSNVVSCSQAYIFPSQVIAAVCHRSQPAGDYQGGEWSSRKRECNSSRRNMRRRSGQYMMLHMPALSTRSLQ